MLIKKKKSKSSYITFRQKQGKISEIKMSITPNKTTVAIKPNSL